MVPPLLKKYSLNVSRILRNENKMSERIYCAGGLAVYSIVCFSFLGFYIDIQGSNILDCNFSLDFLHYRSICDAVISGVLDERIWNDSFHARSVGLARGLFSGNCCFCCNFLLCIGLACLLYRSLSCFCDNNIYGCNFFFFLSCL